MSISVFGQMRERRNKSIAAEKDEDIAQTPDPAGATNATDDGDNSEQSDAIVYENAEYGFRFELQDTWEGYTVVSEKWEGSAMVEQ